MEKNEKIDSLIKLQNSYGKDYFLSEEEKRVALAILKSLKEAEVTVFRANEILNFCCSSLGLNPKIEVQTLTQNEFECIARHIKELVECHFKENAHSACYDCRIKCSEVEKTINPWTAFFKLSDITGVPISVLQGHSKKQDNGHICP